MTNYNADILKKTAAALERFIQSRQFDWPEVEDAVDRTPENSVTAQAIIWALKNGDDTELGRAFRAHIKAHFWQPIQDEVEDAEDERIEGVCKTTEQISYINMTLGVLP